MYYLYTPCLKPKDASLQIEILGYAMNTVAWTVIALRRRQKITSVIAREP
jgi:hypothetical protein